jgi:hypothetical protein
MKKILIFILGFLIGFIIFMPKDNLYYTLQKYLEKEKVYINSNIKSDISLNLIDGTVYYNGMDILRFEKVKILPLILFNELKADNIKVSIKNYKITSLKAFYTLFYPIKIFIKGKSSFGELEGYVDMIKREVKIYILNLTDTSIKSFLKKDKKGYFYYAKF